MPKDLKKHHRRLICSLGLCRTSATCTFLTTRFLYEYYIIKLCWIITMHGVLWMRYLCFSNSISNQTGGGQISLQIKLISFFSWLLNLYCNWISLLILVSMWLSMCFELGISLKTQELYALVFATRYLDIFVIYISLYNTVMKLIFLGTSFSIVWYMRYHKVVRKSYDKDHDTFRHYFLVLPCFVLALLINNKFTFREVGRLTFSWDFWDIILFMPLGCNQ